MKFVVPKRLKEDEWEETLLQVRKDLSAADEKKKREKTYYNSSSIESESVSTDLTALNDLSKPSIYRYKVNIIEDTVLETFIKK
ncbi:hypothetical protein [Planococcus halocryophilus]|uniref:hypothetical protein n=1 Tax=Planococcus halocryophilus TaxID=1215089 RepID=UPI0012DFE8E6|nr:hypothetical protein [Planococcus halocryophilus]